VIELLVRNISSLALALLLLGIQEALIKPIAKTILKKKIIKYAPVAMQFLDEKMPGAFSRYNARDLNIQLKERLELITGESWGEKEIDEMFKIYDPRINANKCIQ
jgi:hypothetical protein